MFNRWLEKLSRLNKSLVFRINILKGFCLLIFFLIAVQLYQVQVIYSGKYTAFLEGGITANLQRNVPRGIISDRNGVVLVDNEAVDIITFQPSPTMSTQMIREISSNLASLIEVDVNRLTSRDLRDLFIFTFPEEARDLITAEERQTYNDIEIYHLQLDRITEEQLAMLTLHDKKAHVIFINMNQGSNLLANTVKNDATPEEIAIVSENLPRLPGVNVGVDWNRTFPSVMGFSSIFGRVSSHEQGVPASRLPHFQAFGYERNARVGLSQLELYYQQLLGGSPSQYLVENGLATRIVEGQQGLELGLTLDAELQAAVSDIVEHQLLHTRRTSPSAVHLREAYVVMMNPNTGEILAMVGKVLRDGENGLEVLDNSLGPFQSSFPVGSSIKAATLLAGNYYGATHINQFRHDSALIFADGSRKSSWRDMGTLNEVTALSQSSNIYFMRQTLEMAGIPNFTTRSSLGGFDLDLWDTYRRFFADFGLGSSTGIDLPNESIGIRDRNRTPTNLLDFSIGQADTYTTLQLAQFASTLATNGHRFAAQIVRDVSLPGNTPEERQLLQSFTPQLLNVINLDDAYFERVHQGHRQALVSGTGAGRDGFGPTAPFSPAGKTGTAQEFARGADGNLLRDSRGEFIRVHNRTFIGYAPVDNPEIAIAVITPQSELAYPSPSNPISLQIARQSMEAYFNLKAE